MKTPLPNLIARAGLAVLLALSIGCYPAYPPGSAYAPAYSQDAKGYEVPYGEPAPAPQAPPVRYGVDPGVVIAGAAAVGLLGYAIGSHHHHGYYAPGPYYYGHGYGYGPYCHPY